MLADYDADITCKGNNYGIGEKRKKELAGSCSALGVDPSRCVALDHKNLQDNPKIWWDASIIQPIVKDYVEKWDIDAVRQTFFFFFFFFFGSA